MSLVCKTLRGLRNFFPLTLFGPGFSPTLKYRGGGEGQKGPSPQLLFFSQMKLKLGGDTHFYKIREEGGSGRPPPPFI